MKAHMSREWFVPKGATKVSDKHSDAVAYLSINTKGKPRATVFFGKQSKPIADYWYANEERRAAAVQELFQNRRDTLGRKAKRREERKNFVHNVKVGDIFKTCWGYDQTNVEYFQIIEVKGKFAILREIAQEIVETGWLRGRCAPLKDKFLTPRYDGDDRGKPIRRLIQDGYIKIDDVRHASPVKMTNVAGVEVANSSYWSSYA